MPLDPQLAPLVEAANQNSGPAMSEVGAPKAREMAMAGVLPVETPEAVGSVVNRTIPGPGGEIPVRIYTPIDATRTGTPGILLFFHGSGFVIFGLDSHDTQCRAICNRAGAIVVSVDYRLAPEHKFPAGPDDCYAALEWAATHAAELGGDASRIAVAGDSAGGCLAAVTAQTTRDRRGPPLCFQALIYPVTDCRAGHPSMDENGEGYMLTKESMLWFIEQYVRDDTDKLDPRCSPLLAASLEGLPPALVQTCEYDPLRDEGEAYARALQNAGVATTLSRYDGLVHGAFQLGAIVTAGQSMLDEVGDALGKALG